MMKTGGEYLEAFARLAVVGDMEGLTALLADLKADNAALAAEGERIRAENSRLREAVAKVEQGLRKEAN